MNQQPTGSFGSGKRLGGKRLWFMVGGVVLALLLIGAGVYALIALRAGQDDGTAATGSKDVCSSDINQQANTYLNGQVDDPLAFPKLAEKVVMMENYQQDPDCLYILVNYNLSKNISQGNDEYLTKLQALYDDGAGLDTVFSPRVGIDELKKQQEALRAVNELQTKADDQADQDSIETLQYAEQL